jgi:hypothetical protein
VPWRDFSGDITTVAGGLLKVGSFLLQQIFAQRGLPLTIDDLRALF